MTVPGAGSDAALCSGTCQQGGCLPTGDSTRVQDALLLICHKRMFVLQIISESRFSFPHYLQLLLFLLEQQVKVLVVDFWLKN